MSIGGKYKNSQNEIQEILESGEKIIKFMPLSPIETPEAINSICDNFNSEIDKDEIEPLFLVPIFIHDFLCIHPFSDGNGRMSRLLTTLLLYKNGYLVGRYISLESKIEKNKKEYYHSLKQSGIGWHDDLEDVTPFIKYFLGIIVSAYRDFEDKANYFEDKVLAIDQVKNAIDDIISKFNKKDLIEKCPSIGVKSIERSLKILSDEGYIIKIGKGKSTFYVKNNR